MKNIDKIYDKAVAKSNKTHKDVDSWEKVWTSEGNSMCSRPDEATQVCLEFFTKDGKYKGVESTYVHLDPLNLSVFNYNYRKLSFETKDEVLKAVKSFYNKIRKDEVTRFGSTRRPKIKDLQWSFRKAIPFIKLIF